MPHTASTPVTPTPAEALPSPLRHQHSRAQWAAVMAMLGTTPAFYLGMEADNPHPWFRIVYVLAAVMLAWAEPGAWRLHRHGQRAHGGAGLARLLLLGLLVSPLVPAGTEPAWGLAWRLGTAFLGLAYTVQTMQATLTRGGLAYLLLVALCVLGLCGLGFWWLEPGTPTLAEGLWLAFTTAATVGYGDYTPTTSASRIFAVFVVLLGYGVLSLVTAAIATTWVENEERRIEREILRSVHREIGSLRLEVKALREAQGQPPPTN